MKLSAREDIAAPIDVVFAAITDFAALERQALRRGFDVTRLDSDALPGLGARWEVGFDYRGHRRSTLTEITGWTPDQGVVFATVGEGLRGTGEVDLIRLAKARTRLHMGVDIRPETFRARLLLQSLKLAKPGLSRRFKEKIAALARQIEARA
ncbi:MAG: SRPBCC family protein [Paracoccaceae bacterium]|nr:SRPBCC family protein [Paracoccaceae bacterium]